MSEIFNILDHKTNIFGKFFLQASAGTGKTFAIEHIFLRHLIDQKIPTSIKEILIVTFTNAATFELQIRLKKALENSIAALKHEKIDPIFSYLTTYPKTKTLRILQDALLSFDQAQIFTIHSFCLHMLKEEALLSNVGLSSQQRDDAYRVKQQELLNFLKYHIKLPSFGSMQGEILLQYGSTNELIDKLAEYGEKEFSCEEKDFYHFFQEFKKVLSSSFSFLRNNFDSLFPCFKKVKNISKEELFEQASLLALLTNELSLEEFDNIIQPTFFSFLKFFSVENKKIKNKISKDLEENIKKFSSSFAFLAELSDERKIIKRLAYNMREPMEKLFSEKEVLTFDRMLKQMQKIVHENHDFANKITAKYKVIVIDEFQDTDPIQLDILKTLFLDKKILSFYLIGDPKQSIYGFRNADLYSYFAAQQLLGKENIAQLDTNFRSDKNLIEALNTLFSKKEWLKLPKINSFLPYLPVKAAIEENYSFNDDKKPLHFFLGEDKSATNRRWPSSYLEEELFFPFIAQEILKLKDKSNLKIAILVSDRYQLERIKKILREKNIPSLGICHENILDTYARTILEEMINAAFYFPDRSKIKIALHGPYFNYPLEKLVKLTENEILFFYKMQELINLNFATFFSALLKSSIDGKRSVEENILINGGKSFYQDTMQLIELLLQQENIPLKDVFSRLAKKDPETLKRKITYDDTNVEIMTIHKSKGLEFDIVFALGLATRTSEIDDFRNEEEIREEKLRQFYVALTRAKKRVYVPIAIDKKEGEKEKTSSCDLFFSCDEKEIFTQLDLLCPSVSYEVLSSKPYNFAHEEQNSSSLMKALCSPNIVTKKTVPFNIFSFSGLHQEDISPSSTRPILISPTLTKPVLLKPVLAKQVLLKPELLKEKQMPIGTEVGVILHAILCEIFKKGVKNADIEEIINQKIMFSILQEYKDEIFSMITETLSFPLLNDQEFTLYNVEKAVAEAEFLFSCEKNYLKGFLDLFFCYKNKYYLVDWKSNYLGETKENYNEENLKKAMQEHEYCLQASIYAEAFLRYLKTIEEENNFGGMFYVFLRGVSVYHLFPEKFKGEFL